MTTNIKKRRTVATTEGSVADVRIIYTTEQKLGAIKMLRDNNFNYNLVATKLGINKGTLRSWNTRYKGVQPDETTRVIAAKVELDLQKLKVDFISKNYKEMDQLAQDAIVRARFLIVHEEDLDKVGRILKILTDFFAKMHTPSADDAQQPGSAVTVNLIQQSIQMLNKAKE